MKVLIEIKQGAVVNVCTSSSTDIVIVDHDAFHTDGCIVSPVLEPDSISDNMWELFNDGNPQTEEIRNELKTLKF